MSSFIIFNGSFFPSGTPLLTADNQGFRYGDGLFETIRVKEGRILLSDHHFQRLFNGSHLLGLKGLTPDQLSAAILDLCERNGHAISARVRLTVFRGDAGQEHGAANYIIQSWHLERPSELNEKGLILGVFPTGRKSCDAFANIKSNNYLLYSMAGQYAVRHGWDDCLVLNSLGRVADSSIANLFYVQGGTIYTPSLSEGCVAGVMRRWLIESLPAAGFRVEERPVAPEDLILAEEVFVSNAIRGVRWVRSFGGVTYGNGTVRDIKRIEHEGIG
ncbi:aminotransferase class IV [Flavitalea sp. BT771]|uniref:aminotransferase class IV n=1 Tax=Flavitalea sp. BT771 TaxID=3063329 RepID=UPI0026E2B4D5|nr:aminotransferase class IV [Flavitalea sp. BT771]MDO6429699.1 aminotransferase class IV [Flavitalea sp. BT771]MDV6218173.1 aminotransferase class IV [Flavitalea sp. BT771]